MATNRIDKKQDILFNSVPDQTLTYANQLTLKAWNDTINILRTQANVNAEYILTLHKWLIGTPMDTAKYIEVPNTTSFTEYVLEDLKVLHAHIVRIDKNIDDIEADIVRIDKNIDDIEENIDEIESDIIRIDENIDNIESDINDIESNIDSIESNIDDIEDDIVDLNQAVEDGIKYTDEALATLEHLYSTKDYFEIKDEKDYTILRVDDSGLNTTHLHEFGVSLEDKYIPRTEGVVLDGDLVKDELVTGSQNKIHSSGFTISMLMDAIHGIKNTHVLNSIADAFSNFEELPNKQETFPESFTYEISDTIINKVAGGTFSLDELHTGDVILSVKKSEPDFFINRTDTSITFYKLETDVGKLVDYLTKIEAEKTYLKQADAFSKNYNDLDNKPIENEETNGELKVVDNNGNVAVRIDNSGLDAFNILEKSVKLEDKYLQKSMVFTGTYDEYLAADAEDLIPIGCVVYILEEEEDEPIVPPDVPDVPDVDESITAILGKGKLGYMILGKGGTI